MLPRINYLRQGCLLLIGLVLTCATLGWSIVTGTTAETLTRLVIILQIFGVASVIPEFIGEQRLRVIEKNLSQPLKTRRQLRTYLTRQDPAALYDLSGISGVLTLIGNVLISLILIFVWIGVNDRSFTNTFELRVLYIAFTGLGISAATWLILSVLLLIIPHTIENSSFLSGLLAALHSLVTALGTLISAPLAFILFLVMRPLSYLSKYPLRQIILRITIPLTLIGMLLQLVATFM